LIQLTVFNKDRHIITLKNCLFKRARSKCLSGEIYQSSKYSDVSVFCHLNLRHIHILDSWLNKIWIETFSRYNCFVKKLFFSKQYSWRLQNTKHLSNCPYFISHPRVCSSNGTKKLDCFITIFSMAILTKVMQCNFVLGLTFFCF
jgi:hypothetical protein